MKHKNMGGDEHESEYPRKRHYAGLNYFGVFLLISSSSIIFTPLLENFQNECCPNGWEVLIWLALGYAIFSFAIILLITTNVVRFLEKKRADESESHATRNWVKNFKILGTSLLLWFTLIIMFWTLFD
jgi:uncharacterized membrane protein